MKLRMAWKTQRRLVMNEQIFREKILNRKQSPDDLNDYIRVAGRNTWILLIAVFLLIVGTLVWGITGRIDSTVDAVAIVSDGIMVGAARSSDLLQLKSGMKVIMDCGECTIEGLDAEKGMFYGHADLPEGQYQASVVVESHRPMDFLFN